MAKTYTDEFIPLTVSILTVSDTRNRANDTSGNYLADAVSNVGHNICLLYTSPSPRDATLSRMPSSA